MRAATPIWNPDYLASEPTLVTEPKQVVTYNINPKAIWYDGTPITWEDFHWQWRAQNGTNKAYQISSSNGYSDIENVARGRDDREVDRHVQEQVRRLAGALLCALSCLDQQVAADLQRRLERRPAHDGRTVQDRQHRPDGEDGDARAQREVVGQAGQARHASSFARSTPTRKSTRSPTAKSTSWTSAPMSTSTRAREGHRRHRHPLRRRAELPPLHDQRHRSRSCRTSRFARRWRWPSTERRLRGRCWVRSASKRPRSATTLHAEPDGLPGQLRRRRQIRPRPGGAVAGRGGVEARGQRATEGRAHRSRSTASFQRRSPRRGRSRS